MTTRRSTPLIDRFFAQAKIGSWAGCWPWTGFLTNGYGHIRSGAKMPGAYRVAYELAIGPIPDGLHIDHLCRNRSCVNPLHLEPVTKKVNTLRGVSPAAGNRVKTSCPAGHAYDSTNTYTGRNRRTCRRCNAAASAARRARLRRSVEGVSAMTTRLLDRRSAAPCGVSHCDGAVQPIPAVKRGRR